MHGILQRIKDISINEAITIGALERKIGASKGVLSRAISNNTDIQTKWIVLIVENYPQYSTRWLLTGEGSMLIDTNINNADNSVLVELINKQYNRIEDLIRENERLKIMVEGGENAECSDYADARKPNVVNKKAG